MRTCVWDCICILLKIRKIVSVSQLNKVWYKYNLDSIDIISNANFIYPARQTNRINLSKIYSKSQMEKYGIPGDLSIECYVRHANHSSKFCFVFVLEIIFFSFKTSSLCSWYRNLCVFLILCVFSFVGLLR